MQDFLFSRCALHELQVKGDDRGRLVALEGPGDVPFDIARVYYIFDTKSQVSRGFHAHRQLRQLAICVSGGCTIILDDGHARSSVRLDRPTLALEIGPLIWREMADFTKDAVLVVLASARYDSNDYIRDYSAFLTLVEP